MSGKNQGKADNVAGLPTEFRFDDSSVRTVVMLGGFGRIGAERGDDFARLADETQAFLDANQETLNKLAVDGQLSETERKARD